MFLKSFELSIFCVSLLASYVSKSSLSNVYMSSCIPQKQLITYHWALLSMSSKSGISISYSPSSPVKLCPAAGVIRTAFGWANHISWHIESCNILLRGGLKKSKITKKSKVDSYFIWHIHWIKIQFLSQKLNWRIMYFFFDYWGGTTALSIVLMPI